MTIKVLLLLRLLLYLMHSAISISVYIVICRNSLYLLLLLLYSIIHLFIYLFYILYFIFFACKRFTLSLRHWGPFNIAKNCNFIISSPAHQFLLSLPLFAQRVIDGGHLFCCASADLCINDFAFVYIYINICVCVAIIKEWIRKWATWNTSKVRRLTECW